MFLARLRRRYRSDSGGFEGSQVKVFLGIPGSFGKRYRDVFTGFRRSLKCVTESPNEFHGIFVYILRSLEGFLMVFGGITGSFEEFSAGSGSVFRRV